MRIIVLILALLSTPASAQSGKSVIQSGNVTPGHVMMWNGSGIASDGGTAANGFLRSLGVIASGPGICQQSNVVTQPYNQICLAASPSGAQISFYNYAGATGSLSFNINGSIYAFPFPTGGILGPGSTTIGDTACWANLVGTLLSDCGAAGGVLSLGNYSADSTLTITGVGSGPWTGAVTIKCTVATSSQLGCVKPDGTIITVAAGAITVAKATASQFGVIEVDNTTITQSAGVISCATATSSQIGCGEPDAATLKITAGAYAIDLTHKNSWSGSQRGTPTNITISTATFTPNFDTAQNFEIDLIHASCPCTLANPSTTLVAGQSGMIEIHQSATGSDTISTWGSDYQYVGGTASITLSTSANAVDYMPYYVNNAATGIVFGGLLLKPTH